MDLLGHRVHTMVQMSSPNNDEIFQGDNLPIHTSRSVLSRLEEHDDARHHLPWTAQSPDLNIIEPLWSVLESRMRSRFPSPSSLKQLADRLHEQWYRLFRTYMNPFQEGYKLYFMKMVAQLYISKEIYIFHSCFHNFVHPMYIQCGSYISQVILVTFFIIGTDSLLSFQNTFTCAKFVRHLIIMILFCA
jgi:hypothetical protein